MKVVIVEDSKVLRDRLKSMISELADVKIIGEAASKDEAIKLIAETKPEAVIIDIRLANGSGIEVLQNIKKNKGIPLIIILTNYPYPQYKDKCLKAGADFFFDKSTEFVKVTEVLKNFIQNSNTKNE